MPFLVWESPQGRVVRELDRALVVVGRDPGADLVLDHPTVSRRHALVEAGKVVKVTDLRSTSGTRINGARLAPDLPCTLEPGDFLHVGKVVLSLHTTAPPPAPPSPPRPARRAPAPFPWKPVGIALAFLAVIAGSALLAFVGRKEPPPPPPAEAAREPAPKPVPAAPPPRVEPPAPEAPKPVAPPAAPSRAAAGELPPRALAPDLPDLVEIDRKAHVPARVRAIGADEVEVMGADGRVYALPAKRVTKIEDRADLARRVAVARRRLAPDDVPGRVTLAEWCLARLLREEARALVREALSLRPDDAAARAAQARLEERE